MMKSPSRWFGQVGFVGFGFGGFVFGGFGRVAVSWAWVGVAASGNRSNRAVGRARKIIAVLHWADRTPFGRASKPR